MPCAVLQGDMSRLVLAISAKISKRVRRIARTFLEMILQKDSHNHFCETERIESIFFRKTWHIMMGWAFWRITDRIRQARAIPPKVTVHFRGWGHIKGDQERQPASRQVHLVNSGFSQKVIEPNF